MYLKLLGSQRHRVSGITSSQQKQCVVTYKLVWIGMTVHRASNLGLGVEPFVELSDQTNDKLGVDPLMLLQSPLVL